jgi:hypothetical protein
MATVIQIKRSTGVSAPTTTDLAEGELAYIQDRSNSGAGAKLFIESVDSDNSTPLIHAIGGKFYTDIIDGTSATPADFKIGNGATSGGSVKLYEDSDNGANFVALKSPDSVASDLTFVLPASDGSANQVLGTDGSGNLSFLSTTSTLAGATDSNITTPSGGQILVHDGLDSFDNVTLSGDVTMNSAGAVTIAANAVQVGNIDFLVDEDNMVSDSAVKVPTQQSVKAYVDSQLTAQDVDFAGDSGTGAVDLDSQSLTIAGTANEIVTSATGQTLTVGLPTNVTTQGNLTVGGNLTVSGTTTTVDSTTVSVADPVFEIGDNALDDNLDRGIKFKWHNGVSAKIGFFGMDDSDGKFKFIQDATDTSSVFSGSVGNAVFGGLEASGLALSGSITSVDGAAPTAGQLLIGNGSNGDLELATLTAGSNGVTITNADGSITIENVIASTSQVGVASFASSEFSVTGAGEVSISNIDGGSF